MTKTPSPSIGVPREISSLSMHWLRLKAILIDWRRRWIPQLVWYGDELDVVVTFKENRLPHIQSENVEEMGLQCIRQLHQGSLYECEKHLEEIGIEFDKGLGFEGRDWEWDWSLRGPISVRFRGRAERPERRK